MKHKKIKYIIFLLIIIIGISGYFFWQQSQSPVSATITIKDVEQRSEAPVEFERFEGKYFSFSRNTVYIEKNHKVDFENKGTILENALFSTSEVNSKNIALTVENIAKRSMSDTGNYILRKNTPKIYQEEKFDIAETTGVAFTSKQNGIMEKVFFIPRGNYVAEIAFTGPINEEDAFTLEIEQVMKSIQWKK
jgi:hypothetical protein